MESLWVRSKRDRMDGENVGQWVDVVESENWVKLSENRRERQSFAHECRYRIHADTLHRDGAMHLAVDHAGYTSDTTTYPAQLASDRLWRAGRDR